MKALGPALAWLALVAPMAAQEAPCLLDRTPAQLVDALVGMGPPEQYYGPADHLRQAVLAERIAPGASATILDLGIAMAGNDSRLTALRPIVTLLAHRQWDAAIAAVRGIDDDNVMRAGKRLLPLAVELSGDYARLDDLYPFGPDTYTRNLNMSDAWRTALEAGRPAQAVDLFAAHKFGHHTATGYDDLMRELVARGAGDEAARLTGIVEEGLAAYDAEGGLGLCLERNDLETCKVRIAARPDMARLDQFDSGRYADCFLLHRDKGRSSACLSELRAEADAAGFEIDPGLPPTDGITGPVRLNLWGWQAMMGDPQPDAIPDAVFRESGHEVVTLHGRMIAALAFAARDEDLGRYLDRMASPEAFASPSMLDRLTGAPGPDLGRSIDWSYMALAAHHGDVGTLERVARQAEAGPDAQKAALFELDRLYRLRGDAEGALAVAVLLDTPADRLLARSQQARAAGHEALADALMAQVRAQVCDGPAPSGEVRRHLIERLLMAAAVASGGAPGTLFRH